ncbi:MAG: glycosyltransferase [Mitsuaria chitosanitabida]|uniref:glycosyltransferase family 2 protein n=1 Tax=Roseateles chitosanitabidus TaxID=65048 RepID=UPI001B2CACFA|nr:glycosyltransferase [Roseateles chitosanitabidus]MBO9688669.1 glycosyltransferase [Roseateles chitosanitabidus]
MSDTPTSRPEPQVTLVVPAFNEDPQVLARSLDSVAAQTFGDFECIVVDESTQAASAEACRALCERDSRFRYVHPEQRLGLAASLNLGISMARAPLIARFDSDDICQAERLALQVDFLRQHPEVDVLGGALEIMDEQEHTLAFRAYPATDAAIQRRFDTTSAVAHPTVMMRKSVLDRFGMYDPTFRFAEDLDLWLRLSNHGVRFANLSQVLVRYRQADTSRNRGHWDFNLRARTRNFSWRGRPRRALGIAAIAIWARIPRALQQRVFHGVLLQRQQGSESR